MHWHRLPREVVASPSLELLKNRGDVARNEQYSWTQKGKIIDFQAVCYKSTFVILVVPVTRKEMRERELAPGRSAWLFFQSISSVLHSIQENLQNQNLGWICGIWTEEQLQNDPCYCVTEKCWLPLQSICSLPVL